MKVILLKEAIAERMKTVRDDLNYSQKKMAEIVGTKFRSYQTNERAVSIPGGAILAGYVKIGINVNWLLTGEGSMLIEEMKKTPTAMKNMETATEDRGDKQREIDPTLLSQIVVALEVSAFESPKSMLKFRDFIQQFKQPLLWTLKVEEPPSAKEANEEIDQMIKDFRYAWIKYAGTQAGIASYIYDRVADIESDLKRKQAIDKEVDFFFKIKMDEFAHQFRDPSVQTPIIDPNHVSTGGINF